MVLTTDLKEERTCKGAVLYAGETELIVAASRAHQDRFIVKFEGVDSREAADLLRGQVLTADALGEDGNSAYDDMVFAHDVIGLTLVDQDGTAHGEVVSLLANPASDLMELANGALVPMAFYVSHDEQQVRVDVPEGLLSGDEA